MTRAFRRSVPCPLCGAAADELCRSQRRNDRQPMAHVHDERLPAARVAYESTFLDPADCGSQRHTATDWSMGRCHCHVGRSADNRYRREIARVRAELGGAVQRIDPTGSRRRVQALQRIGVTYEQMADISGLGRQTLIDATRRRQIYRSTAEVIAAMYDRLSEQPEAPNHARDRARYNGHPGPWCWTPATIDDPDAQPGCTDYDPDAVDVDLLVERIRAGRLDPRQLDGYKTRRAVAARMLSDGRSRSFNQVMQTMHMSGHRLLQIAEAS